MSNQVSNEIIEMSHEQAYSEIDNLTDKTIHYGEGATVYRGTHTVYGVCVFIVPPFGQVMIAPLCIINPTFDGSLAPG